MVFIKVNVQNVNIGAGGGGGYAKISFFLVVVFVLNVPPTAKVIWRRGSGLKSHPTDW